MSGFPPMGPASVTPQELDPAAGTDVLQWAVLRMIEASTGRNGISSASVLSTGAFCPYLRDYRILFWVPLPLQRIYFERLVSAPAVHLEVPVQGQDAAGPKVV